MLVNMKKIRPGERRLIGQILPIREISKGGAAEKSRTTGRISNIHRWWATKPTTVSRIITYAALVDPPLSDHQEMIQDMCDYTRTTDPNKPSIRDHVRDRIRDIRGGGRIIYQKSWIRLVAQARCHLQPLGLVANHIQ